MNASKRKRLKAAGWRTGTGAEFLGLDEQEAALVDLKLSLVEAVRRSRRTHGLSQVELAKRMRSSQSRIAKIEAGDASVSLDLIVRALLATGAGPRELRQAFVAME